MPSAPAISRTRFCASPSMTRRQPLSIPPIRSASCASHLRATSFRQARINRMTAQYIETYFDRPVIHGRSGIQCDQQPSRSSATRTHCRSRSITDSRATITSGSVGAIYRIRRSFRAPSRSDFLYDQDPKNIAIGWNRIFSPRLILDSKFGFVTQPVNQFGVSSAGLDTMKQLGYGGIDEFGPANIGLAAPYERRRSPRRAPTSTASITSPNG